MELRHLRYFIAVVEEGSFVKAAERLHVSQPPVSTQIRDLEAELGVPLLERGPRGAQPTAAGRAFYAEAKAIEDRVASARRRVRRAAVGEEGTLRVGFVSIADYSVLPPVLRHFHATHPGVELQLHEQTTDVQVRDLLSDHLDVGFALGPIDDARLSFHSLTNERLLVVLPDGHVASARRGPVSLASLADEAFVFVPRPLAPALHDTIVALCRSCGFAPRIAQYANQMQTVVGLVGSGLGVAVVPESIRHLRRPGVSYHAIREPAPTIELGLVHRANEDSPIVTRFRAALDEVRGGHSSK